MKYHVFGLCLAFAVGLVPSFANAQEVSAAATEEVVVDFDDRTDDAHVQSAARSVGVELHGNSFLVGEDRIYRAVVPAGTAEAISARFRALEGVRAAEPNVRMHMDLTPNDPRFAEQWHMTRVGAPAAWDRACGEGVTVAVVDTGVACENYGEFTRVMDLQGTRCAVGYNFVADREHANDDQGHGTHVAGTIAQTTNNGFGVAGLAHCATILPVKVLDANGSGSLADVAEGIRYAADQGARVINLSLGGGRSHRVMAEAVQYARSKGAVVVCAAGNNGRYVESPGSEVGSFAVSAIGPGDEIAWFSSRGPEVDISAPGVNVLQHTICEHGRNRCEQFAAWSGTSMAAPHVAGIAALVASLGVTDVDAIERVLQSTAVVPEHGVKDRELYGAGIVHAEAAVEHVLRQTGMSRGMALLVLFALVAMRIRQQGGKLANPFRWAPLALFSGVGAFFLPRFLPHTAPGADFLMRPLGDWSLFLGEGVHRWLPFANAGFVLTLVGLGFGRTGLRAPIGGVALGTAAYLLGTGSTGFHAGPMGMLPQSGWFLFNAVLCLWVARIGLDKKTAE